MHNWESSTQQDQAFSAAEIDTLLDEDNDDGQRGSSSTTITAHFRRHRSLVAVTILMSLVSVAGSLYYIYYSRPSSQSDLNSLSELSSSDKDHDTPPDETDESQQKNKLFAHLHVAKSGGTSLLYELAHLYQNVCGNKYNSKNLVEKNPDLFKGFKRSGEVSKLLQLQDQCDYMSLEVGYNFWLKQNWTRPLELHIPCKDPIELLMSNCYWPPKSNVGFDCSPTNVTPNALRQQIDNCLSLKSLDGRLRFNKHLSEQAPRHNITIKCFDAKKEFTEYIDYMGARLEHYPKVEDLVRFSKKEDGELVTVERPWSFSARNKSAECIWKDSDLLQRAKAYLFEKYFYFPFCRECLNSSDNLLAK